MKLDNIFSDFVNHVGDEKRSRTIGRYWASDIESIKKGYLTPQNFFEQRKVDDNGVRMILSGIAFENMLTKIFEKQKVECITQEKKTLKITDDIELVVKPDFVFPEFIIETKFPFSSINSNEIPERYKSQLECEYRAFEPKRVYLGVFTVPFNMTMIEYIPSQKRWSNVKKVLTDFHEKVKQQAEIDAKL